MAAGYHRLPDMTVTSRWLAFVLYLATAIFTGAFVLHNALWGFWGAHVSPLSILSLLGSGGLLCAAFAAKGDTRKGGRIAFISMLMVWVFFAPSIATEVRNFLSSRDLTVKVIKVKQDSLELTLEDATISDEEKRLLAQAGIKGRLNMQYMCEQGEGEPAKVLLILQKPLTQKVSLRQPKNGVVVYTQTESGMRMWPEKVETFDRAITLEPSSSGMGSDPKQNTPPSTRASIEMADGSSRGFEIGW